MRIVIGGAYNGKRNFVAKTLRHRNQKNVYQYEGEIPKGSFTKDDIVIIGSLENVIMKSDNLDEDEIAKQIFDDLKELDVQTNLICICTDIGRGIVPLEKNERKLRDACGRLYQRLFSECAEIVRVWYGIPQYIKGEKWDYE
ncbi:bifunctional adenosylcobinamide kinase/adenosylcobinamide-phosphate guanylyltransferase [Ureibacillus composti]|nr:bifunctional adenosylcobinamide kinase/adenosylcobinamide-phosphate guanylyltransferase [Ureibacillus composti]